MDRVIKYGALALLVLQNTALVLTMRYSRVSDGPRYVSSTAVASMELVKFVTCLAVLFAQGKYSLARFSGTLSQQVVNKPLEVVKLSVPSLLYMVQNNLLYFALSHLSATPYQVLYQLKILTSAVFSVLMLPGKRLSALKWFSLLVLTFGVVLTKTSQGSSTDGGQDSFMGFVAVILASVTSGFAGVYFERVLKGSHASLWLRNIQMGCCSIVLSFATVYWQDGEQVREQGFFYGYNRVVVAVILLQALGGIVVALVVKYADNILKGFAASFSIVTSCILEMLFFEFAPNVNFFLGAVLVNVSIALYGYDPKSRRRRRAPGAKDVAPDKSGASDRLYEKV
uniref:UDP-N-acetylglucosamine transporter n=1 Tax=Rhizochromulina marina TaxID=1034831 RepID=A0A7S2WAX6_9STRA